MKPFGNCFRTLAPATGYGNDKMLSPKMMIPKMMIMTKIAAIILGIILMCNLNITFLKHVIMNPSSTVATNRKVKSSEQPGGGIDILVALSGDAPRNTAEFSLALKGILFNSPTASQESHLLTISVFADERGYAEAARVLNRSGLQDAPWGTDVKIDLHNVEERLRQIQNSSLFDRLENFTFEEKHFPYLAHEVLREKDRVLFLQNDNLVATSVQELWRRAVKSAAEEPLVPALTLAPGVLLLNLQLLRKERHELFEDLFHEDRNRSVSIQHVTGIPSSSVSHHVPTKLASSEHSSSSEEISELLVPLWKQKQTVIIMSDNRYNDEASYVHLSVRINRAYAESHGYRFHICDQNKKTECVGHSAVECKLFCIREVMHLEDVETVFYLDSDAIFRDFALPVGKFVEQNVPHSILYDLIVPEDCDAYQFNAGVQIWNNTVSSQNLMDEWIERTTTIPKYKVFPAEQQCLVDWYNEENSTIRDRVITINRGPDTWMVGCCHCAYLAPRYLAHVTGRWPQSRIPEMNKTMSSIYDLTNGRIDIASGSTTKQSHLYYFAKDGPFSEFPDVKALVQHYVDLTWRRLKLIGGSHGAKRTHSVVVSFLAQN